MQLINTMVYSYAWKSVLNPGGDGDFFLPRNFEQFNVDDQSFNRTNGWWLSELSRLIYAPGGGCQSTEKQTLIRNTFLQRNGLEERWFYNGRYVQCAIIGNLSGNGKPFSVLVFKGTQGGISDWLFNVSSILSPWVGGGAVHKGFKVLLLKAWDEIEQKLKDVSRPIFYAGHSRGGALAVLAASLRKPQAVYTFGSPRIGDTRFCRVMESVNIYRVVNPKDIVTNVPPLPGILGVRHVGRPQCLKRNEIPWLKRSLFDAPTCLAAHSPSNYSGML